MLDQLKLRHRRRLVPSHEMSQAFCAETAQAGSRQQTSEHMPFVNTPTLFNDEQGHHHCGIHSDLKGACVVCVAAEGCTRSGIADSTNLGMRATINRATILLTKRPWRVAAPQASALRRV